MKRGIDRGLVKRIAIVGIAPGGIAIEGRGIAKHMRDLYKNDKRGFIKWGLIYSSLIIPAGLSSVKGAYDIGSYLGKMSINL